MKKCFLVLLVLFVFAVSHGQSYGVNTVFDTTTVGGANAIYGNNHKISGNEINLSLVFTVIDTTSDDSVGGVLTIQEGQNRGNAIIWHSSNTKVFNDSISTVTISPSSHATLGAGYSLRIHGCDWVRWVYTPSALNHRTLAKVVMREIFTSTWKN